MLNCVSFIGNKKSFVSQKHIGQEDVGHGRDGICNPNF